MIALLRPLGFSFSFLTSSSSVWTLLFIGDELGELQMEIQKVGVRDGSVFDQHFVVAGSGHSRESYHETTLVGPADFRDFYDRRKAREGL